MYNFRTNIFSEDEKKIPFFSEGLMFYFVLSIPPPGEVNFIDYEYAFLNHQAYDIGNHFCEYAGNHGNGN